jgi:predicted ATP-grasp superfamily ATP-dependent carboligase
MVPAIVISGGPAGLAVVRALGKAGIPIVMVTYAHDDVAHFSRYVQEVWRAPHPETFTEDFVIFLLNHGPDWRGSLLIPCADAALSAISKFKRALADFYRVACPDWESTRRFLEKKNTRELASAAGVAAPWTLALRGISDLEDQRPKIDFPCLAKPSVSHTYQERFGAKMKRVESFDEAVVACQEASSLGLEMMLQEFIPGDDGQGVNYNSYYWNGEPLVEFTAQKVRNAPPVYGSPRVVRSKRIEDVLECGRRLLAAAKFSGFSCTEFKKDPRDGKFKLMEVNARHNLSSALAVRCGINFPLLQYRHLICGELPQPGDFTEGIYWIEPVKDLTQSAKYYREERYGWRDYLRPYASRHVFATYDSSDPQPFISQCKLMAKETLLRFRGRASSIGRNKAISTRPVDCRQKS